MANDESLEEMSDLIYRQINEIRDVAKDNPEVLVQIIVTWLGLIYHDYDLDPVEINRLAVIAKDTFTEEVDSRVRSRN